MWLKLLVFLIPQHPKKTHELKVDVGSVKIFANTLMNQIF